MIIVTTPMCKKIVEFAGITNFKVNKYPDNETGDLAILLSENRTKMPSLNIKLNTFSQIKESIFEVANYSNVNENQNISNFDINSIFEDYDFATIWGKNSEKIRLANSNKNVKVYSNFLKDIVVDIGCNIIDDSSEYLNESNYDYVIFPDYLKEKVSESSIDFKFIEVPTHSNVSLDPIIRAETRYKLLINNL